MADRLHAGHRGRMREKFTQFGQDVFHTHELLEMLLFYAVKQRNTNPIAKELINKFGSLDGVFSATREELLTVQGVGEKIADMILEIGEIGIEKLFNSEGKENKSYDNYESLGEFFTKYFDGCFEYRVSMMMLNSRLECIAVSDMYSCDYGMSAVRSEKFIAEALKHRATVVAIAHNHPFGPSFPTQSDLATNDMLYSAFSGVGITLMEDYVVSGNDFVGYMRNLDAAFSVSTYIDRFLDSKNGGAK